MKAITTIFIIALLALAGCVSSPETVKLRYEPKQCEQEPWGSKNIEALEKFYAEKGVVFSNVSLVARDGAVCMACNICPKTYYYEATVNAGKELLLNDGWELTS